MQMTPRQSEIMTLLLAGSSMSVTAMVYALDLNRNGSSAENIKYNMQKLLDMGYVVIDEARSTRAGNRYAATSQGINAMNKSTKANAQQIKTTADTASLFERVAYVPPPAFYRNNGNVHICSVGVRC
jgi:predicted ArsR family transcriptional regulator